MYKLSSECSMNFLFPYYNFYFLLTFIKYLLCARLLLSMKHMYHVIQLQEGGLSRKGFRQRQRG